MTKRVGYCKTDDGRWAFYSDEGVLMFHVADQEMQFMRLAKRVSDEVLLTAYARYQEVGS